MQVVGAVLLGTVNFSRWGLLRLFDKSVGQYDGLPTVKEVEDSGDVGGKYRTQLKDSVTDWLGIRFSECRSIVSQENDAVQ